MKIIQSNNVSLNCLIARENGDEDWLPDEGWAEFVRDAVGFQNFIMGRKTYEYLKDRDPDYDFDNVAAKHKIIVTSDTGYEAPRGYAVCNTPRAAVDFLESHGVDAGLLIGGGDLNKSFYDNKLVDETWVTITPFILGNGRPCFGVGDYDVELQLQEVVRLSNDRVQLKYRVKR